ncbi:MAG: hypothetical protein IKM73_13690 [Acidaminococcaceae bacterium]|nr:hypothetical protein [Acidaminococcaceae bacterium]
MAVLSFSDILRKNNIDPAKVKLIRHALTDKGFRECYDKGVVYEYTCHQKRDFSKGYEYWAVFISDAGTLAVFFSLYRVGTSVPDTADAIPHGLPAREEKMYQGEAAVFQLEHMDVLQEYEGKLTIDWGKSTRMWHQRGTTEKPIISIFPDKKKVFSGFEDLVLSYDELVTIQSPRHRGQK